ncbi:hypothetical protein ACFOEY_11565 [Paracandidimonas soli]
MLLSRARWLSRLAWVVSGTLQAGGASDASGTEDRGCGAGNWPVESGPE